MRGRRRGFCALLALAWLGAGGCGGGEAGDALAAAEPYVERFDRFDAWARRTIAADPAIRDAAALEETLFAPLVLERDVADAWVLRGGRGRGAWSLRGSTLPAGDAGWVRARHPVHGELGILVAPLRRSPRGPESPCLFLSRGGPGAASSRVDVVLAFVIATEDAT